MKWQLDRDGVLYIHHIYIQTEQKQCFAPSVLLVIMLCVMITYHLKMLTTWAGMAVRCQFSVLVNPLYW